jgi:hypothetical protein
MDQMGVIIATVQHEPDATQPSVAVQLRAGLGVFGCRASEDMKDATQRTNCSVLKPRARTANQPPALLHSR